MARNETGYAYSGNTITPSDTDDVSYDRFWLETASTVKIGIRGLDNKENGTLTVDFPAGYHDIAIKKVYATGTTLAGVMIGYKVR